MAGKREPQRSNLSALAAEFVPGPPPTAQQLRDQKSLLEIDKMMTTLSSEPAIFNQYKHVCLGKLNQLLHSDKVFRAAVSIVFDKCVNEQSLRYNGARLCLFVSDTLNLTFEELLRVKCRDELQKSETTLRSNVARFHGLVYFFGELFVCFSSTRHKAVLFGNAVCHLLSLLLDAPNEENLKCVGQVLKLVGAAMLDKFSSSSSNCFDDVLDKLKGVLMGGSVGVLRREVLMKVLELRRSNWGRELREEAAGGSSEEYERERMEEMQFLDTYVRKPAMEDEGMTEEMVGAFGKFLKKEKKK